MRQGSRQGYAYPNCSAASQALVSLLPRHHVAPYLPSLAAHRSSQGSFQSSMNKPRRRPPRDAAPVKLYYPPTQTIAQRWEPRPTDVDMMGCGHDVSMISSKLTGIAHDVVWRAAIRQVPQWSGQVLRPAFLMLWLLCRTIEACSAKRS